VAVGPSLCVGSDPKLRSVVPVHVAVSLCVSSSVPVAAGVTGVILCATVCVTGDACYEEKNCAAFSLFLPLEQLFKDGGCSTPSCIIYASTMILA